MSDNKFICTLVLLLFQMVSIIVIKHYQSFVCTHWSGLGYCYLTLIILFNTIHLFAHSQIVPSIVM